MILAERYILINWIKTFIFIILVLVFFYIMIDTFAHIEDIVKSKTSVFLLLKYYFFSLPLISMYILVPLASVITSSFVFTEMMYHREIIALRTLGFSIFKIVRGPFLVLTVISLFFIYFSETHLINFLEEYQILKSVVFSHSPTKHRSFENLTYLSPDGEIIFLKSLYADQNKAKGILIFDQKNSKKIQAYQGIYKKGKWTLYNVYVHYLTKEGMVEFFKEIPYDLPSPQKLSKRADQFFEILPSKVIRERMRYFSKLGSPEISKIWEVELHKKFVVCIFSLILNISLIGTLLRIKRGKGIISNFGISVFQSFLFYVLFSIFIALGKAGWLHPFWSGWFIPLIFILWGVLNIFSLL